MGIRREGNGDLPGAEHITLMFDLLYGSLGG